MLLFLHVLNIVALAVIKLVCLLVAIAYFTLAERKIMAAVQRRVGPNVVGLLGLLQPLADGLKLAGKEAVIPSQASGRIFMSAAIAVLLFALSGWSTIPFGLVDHSETMSPAALADMLWAYDQHVGRKGLNQSFGAIHNYLAPYIGATDDVVFLRQSFNSAPVSRFVKMTLIENMQHQHV